MKINLTGSLLAIFQTMRSMRDNGIPFIFYDRFGDHVWSMGSRQVVSDWAYNEDELGDNKIPHSSRLVVRKRDLDLIILLSTAAVIREDQSQWII